MGYSASATLFYGVVLGQDKDFEFPELELSDEHQEEYEEDPYDFLENYLFSKKTGFPLYLWRERPDDYYEKRKAAGPGPAVSLQQYGSVMGEYGSVVLDAGAGGYTSWGSAQRLILPTADTSEMDKELDWALEVLGIEKPAEGYGWYLAASYG